MVNIEARLVQEAENALRRVLDELGGLDVRSDRGQRAGDKECDVLMQVTHGGTQFGIALEARSRITPQTAVALCERVRRLPDHLVPMVYAPVISPRVAEIAEQFGVGYVDQAGNCRLRSAGHGILIDRRGYKAAARPVQGVADVFSPKSSRIVRAMLGQPARGWQVRELAEHPDVGVAVGLVSKVKRSLLEQGYAVEHKRRLYLRDPAGLLENWAKKYSGPAEQIAMYFRGDTEAAERAVGNWCRDNAIPSALAGFSAAWRLAPEVRYSVGAVYVDSRAFDRDTLDRLGSSLGGKRAETGANLLLWRPFDRSVLAGCQALNRADPPVSSALQAYLDLRQLTGRGEEAATAVYKKHLTDPLHHAARRVEEMRHDAL